MPKFHREVPLGTRVLIPEGQISDKRRTGTVVGITFTNIFFTYIVLLDDGCEVVDVYGKHRAVGVPGQVLCEEDGTPFALPLTGLAEG